jgi:hypothetical protein
MNKILAGAMALALGAIPAAAQSFGDQNIQIHGFATQAFVVSSYNNYLGMDTRTGAPSWTEAALNVNDQVSEKLRVGIQLHYTRLGAFGGDNINVDWALGDYSINQWMGLRAGKVKIRWGLYNDTQDYDPGYLWSLLPESIYGIDIRATNLSQLGVEFYGKLPLARKFGRLNYSAYYGYYYFASDDGYRASMAQSGLVFNHMPGGKTPGLDLRWETPVRGLKVGGSLMVYNASGNLVSGTYTAPYAYWPTGYAQYEFKKFFSSYQYAKLVSYQTATIPGSAPVTTGSDARQWFATGGYHLSEKFQAGVYYSKYTVPSAGDNSNPANHFKDWAVSGRYDFNSYFYGKIEGHFIDGNALGFYALNNPDGLKPKTNLLVAKVGFTF